MGDLPTVTALTSIHPPSRIPPYAHIHPLTRASLGAYRVPGTLLDKKTTTTTNELRPQGAMDLRSGG